jgi:hypothetical protein
MRVQHSIQRCLFALLCLLGSSQLAACGTSGTGNSQDTGIPPGQVSQAGLSPLILHDPSPGQLSVFVAVKIGGYDAVTRDKTTIDLLFSSKGRAVQFAGSEQLVCNGKTLPLHTRPEDSQIAGPTSALEGQTFHCTYSAGHTSATLTFTVPHTPTISVPQGQARLPRSKNTLVAYNTQGGTLMGIVALGSPAKAIARLATPGAGQATVDTSSFPTGAGSIALTETLTISVTQTGTSFVSLGARGDVLVSIDVTWI